MEFEVVVYVFSQTEVNGAIGPSTSILSLPHSHNHDEANSHRHNVNNIANHQNRFPSSIMSSSRSVSSVTSNYRWGEMETQSHQGQMRKPMDTRHQTENIGYGIT
jgi:hypothetical protein